MRKVLLVTGVALGLVLVAGTIVAVITTRTYRIPSESMLPTLRIDDRILVRDGGDVQVGDLAVSHPPAGAMESRCGATVAEDELCPRPAGDPVKDITFVQRVVAKGGDRIAVRDGRVVRNGRRLDEPYIRACAPGGGFGCSFRGEITVPDGHVFLLGDNRGASDDSRFWGPVPESSVVGPVIGRHWPPGRWGTP